MADDTSNPGQGDRQRINVNQPHEVKYWTQALGVSEQQLKDAVKTAGVMASDVRRELGKQ